MTNEQIYRRQQEFRDIRDLAWNNAIVSHFIEAYIHGAIVTKEECCFQIIRELAKTRDEITKQMTEEVMMRSTFRETL